MTENKKARFAQDVEPANKSSYPEILAEKVKGRDKRRLGDVFGLQNFGVNLTTLRPGAMSALLHAHAVQDEFIYILSGTPVLVTESGETTLSPGMCAGFPAGSDAHHLVNRSDESVTYIEIGDRLLGDSVRYPEDDLSATNVDGKWVFTKKDGTSLG